jgi:diguanylate cyclase (GGDEF)-like protein/PAS domain S-box-containing protein
MYRFANYAARRIAHLYRETWGHSFYGFGREAMEPSTSSRARISITFLVTMVIVLAEFGFLQAVYHLDDRVETQRAAQARVTGALETWQSGADTDPVEEAVRGLVATDTPGSAELQTLARTWAGSLEPADLARLQSANATVARDLLQDQQDVDHRAAVILACLLILVSIGWFFWFRRLVRRHRELQRAVTEKQVLDSGERRLLALVQNSADLVAVIEPDSTASFVSPAASSVLGLAPEDIVGTRFVDLLLPRDVPMFIRMLAASREGDQPIILRTRHADGRDLVLEGTLTNLMADAAVHGWVLTVRDVTDRQALQQELSYQAFHDALTGLANRQLFAERLTHALRRRDGATEPLVVLFLDLDDFKHVNDSLGHGIGDRLLVAVAERIAGAIREGDTAARLGGDEFAVLMEDADAETAHEIAERLLQALAVPVAVDEHLHSVRASIGMAEAMPGEATGEETLRNADVAMYWAKDRGKGTVAVYEAGLHAEALERLALRSELQRAIREEQLTLHYQPTVDLTTQRITGFEALVRWNHPTRGLLPPIEFIPVAEQSGLIVPLGSWVLLAACRAGADMQSEWHQPTMAVNIAAQQLAKDDFVDEVVSVLRRTRMPAERLILEITESVLLDDMVGTIATLARLRDRGIRVAIDDFGTGYSSLSYLAQLPVDVLKVDKSFVDRVCGDSPDTSLVEAIITMSHSMRLTTVAEGVELPEQAAWLQHARCSLGQGYLWSRPVELGVARDLLVRGTHRVPVASSAAAPATFPGDGDDLLVAP